MPIGRRDTRSPGSAQLPATAAGRTADLAWAHPLTGEAWSRRVLAVAALFAGLWALFTVVAGPAGAADDAPGASLPTHPYPVEELLVGAPVEAGELPGQQVTAPQAELLPDTPAATVGPDASRPAVPDTATVAPSPPVAPAPGPAPQAAVAVPVPETDSSPVAPTIEESTSSTEESTPPTEESTSSTDESTPPTDEDPAVDDQATVTSGDEDDGVATSDHETDASGDEDAADDEATEATEAPTDDGTETPPGDELEGSADQEQTSDSTLAPVSDAGIVVAPEITDPAAIDESGCAVPLQPADGASPGPGGSPVPAACDPTGAVETVPTEPDASVTPADTALPAEISPPDGDPALPSVDEAEVRSATPIAASPRRQASEPGLMSMTPAQPAASDTGTAGGPLPVWPSSPAPPTVPMLPSHSPTAASGGTSASGTGQHHESYSGLAILDAGPAIVFGQLGGGSTSSLAAHVIGGADDPGSHPA